MDAAAETFCTARGELGLNGENSCRNAFREEAVERLGDQQRQDLRAAEAAGRVTWAVAAR